MNKELNQQSDTMIELKSWINKNWEAIDKIIDNHLTKVFWNDLSPDSKRLVMVLTENISSEVKDEIMKIINVYEVIEE